MGFTPNELELLPGDDDRNERDDEDLGIRIEAHRFSADELDQLDEEEASGAHSKAARFGRKIAKSVKEASDIVGRGGLRIGQRTVTGIDSAIEAAQQRAGDALLSGAEAISGQEFESREQEDEFRRGVRERAGESLGSFGEMAAKALGRTEGEQVQRLQQREEFNRRLGDRTDYSEATKKAEAEGRYLNPAFLIEKGVIDVGGQLGMAVATGGVGLGLLATQEGGGTRDAAMRRMIDRGFSVDEAENIATSEGALSSVLAVALERIPLGAIGKKAKGKIVEIAKQKIAAVGLAAGGEALEETAQGTAQDFAQYLLEDDKTAFEGFWDRRIQEAVLGAFGGGAAGSAVQVSRALSETQAAQVDSLVEQLSEASSTPEGMARLEELSKKENPTRADFREAGLNAGRTINAQQRKAVAESIDSEEIQSLTRVVRDMAGAAEKKAEAELNMRSLGVVMDLASNAGEGGTASAQSLIDMGVSQDRAIDIIKEKWLEEDVDAFHRRKRIGKKKSSPPEAPKITDQRAKQLQEIQKAYKEVQPEGTLSDYVSPEAPTKSLLPDVIRDEEGSLRIGREDGSENIVAPADSVEDAFSLLMQSTAVQATKRVFMRAFSPSGNVGKSVMHARNESGYSLSRMHEEASRNATDLNNAIQEEASATGEKVSAVKQVVNKVMRKEAPVSVLSTNLQGKVKAARDHVDALSRLGNKSGAFAGAFGGELSITDEVLDGLTAEFRAGNMSREQLNSNIAESLGTDADSAHLVVEIALNEGMYLARSYKAFKDSSTWKKEMPDEIREGMFQYLKSQNPNLTDQQANLQMNQILENARQSKDLVGMVANPWSQNRDTIKALKDMPEAYRKFLGEETDPVVNYLLTVGKQSALITQYQLADNLRSIGLGNFLFQEGDPNMPEDAVLFAKPGDRAKSRLAGLYVSPQMKSDLDAFFKSTAMEPTALRNTISWLNTAWKSTKTIFNPDTHTRQVIGNGLMLLMNGQLNVHDAMVAAGDMLSATKILPEFVNDSWRMARGRTEEEIAAERLELIELGLIGSDTNVYDLSAKETSALTKTLAEVQETITGSGIAIGAGRSLKKLWEVSRKIYGSEDAIFKVASYRSNLKRYGKSDRFPDTPEGREALKQYAARVTRETLPTAEHLPRAMTFLRQYGITAPFAAFPYAITTAYLNSAIQTVNDLRSPDPAFKAVGLRRLAGMAAMKTLGLGGLAAFTKMMHGISDEEEEAYRKLSGPFNENAHLIMTRDDNGNLQHRNVTYLNPYSSIHDPVSNYLQGRTDGVGFLNELMDPFLGLSPLLAIGSNLESNRDNYDKKIRDENMAARDQLADIARYLWKEMAPGAAVKVENLVKAHLGEHTPGGKRYTYSSEIQKTLTGTKVDSFEPKQQLDYAFDRFKKSVGSASGLLYKIGRTGTMTDGEIQSLSERAQERYDLAIREANEFYEAASIVDPTVVPQVLGMMDAKGLSDEYSQVITGNPEPFLPRGNGLALERLLRVSEPGEYRTALESAYNDHVRRSVVNAAKKHVSTSDKDNVESIKSGKSELSRMQMSPVQAAQVLFDHHKEKAINRSASTFQRKQSERGIRVSDSLARAHAVQNFGKFRWTENRLSELSRLGLTNEEILDFRASHSR